jgi:hypothetical protein
MRLMSSMIYATVRCKVTAVGYRDLMIFAQSLGLWCGKISCLAVARYNALSSKGIILTGPSSILHTTNSVNEYRRRLKPM